MKTRCLVRYGKKDGMNPRNIKSAIFICACLIAPLWADAYNNTIELRNDSPGAQYFSFRYRESYEKDPVSFYLQSRDPESWIVKADGSYSVGGSCNAVIWGIKAEYDHVDGIVEGTNFTYFKDKNISSQIEIRPDLLSIVTRDMEGFPEDYNVSRTFGNHQQDWDYLVAKKDSILDTAGLTDDSSDWDKALAMAEFCRSVRARPTAPEGQGYWLNPVDFVLHNDYCVGGSNGFVGLCAVMGIPTRTLRTFNHQWTEALIDGKWRYCENSPTMVEDYENPSTVLSGPEQGPLFTFGFAAMMTDPVYAYYKTGRTFVSVVLSDAFIRYDLDASSQWRMYMPGGGGTRGQHSEEKPQMRVSMASAQEISLLYSGAVTTVRTAAGETGMWLNPPFHGQGSWKGWKSGRVDQDNGIRQRFYLSDTVGLTTVTSYLILDSADACDMPADGGDWYYSVNGHKYYLRDHGGWHLESHPYGSQDSAGMKGARSIAFSIPVERLTTEMNTPVAPSKAVSPISAGRISMRSSISTIVFDVPFSGVQRATVHSLNGRALVHAAIENNFLRIPRSVLSSGTYVLSVYGTQGMQTIRFAIQ